MASGTYRNGVVMAPAVAAIIAAEVCGSRSPIENPFGSREIGPTPDFSQLAMSGADDLVSFIQEPIGLLPYNRQEELRDFILALLEMSLGNSPDFDSLRDGSRDLLKAHPLTEFIPIIYYRIHEFMQSRRQAELSADGSRETKTNVA
jgi:hypothetical protein